MKIFCKKIFCTKKEKLRVGGEKKKKRKKEMDGKI